MGPYSALYPGSRFSGKPHQDQKIQKSGSTIVKKLCKNVSLSRVPIPLSLASPLLHGASLPLSHIQTLMIFFSSVNNFKTLNGT